VPREDWERFQKSLELARKHRQAREAETLLNAVQQDYVSKAELAERTEEARSLSAMVEVLLNERIEERFKERSEARLKQGEE
jgi:hypothetical protein